MNRLELGDSSCNERVDPAIRFSASKELRVIKRQSNSPTGDVSVAEIRRPLTMASHRSTAVDHYRQPLRPQMRRSRRQCVTKCNKIYKLCLKKASDSMFLPTFWQPLLGQPIKLEFDPATSLLPKRPTRWTKITRAFWTARSCACSLRRHRVISDPDLCGTEPHWKS